jgi:hypothetical protein
VPRSFSATRVSEHLAAQADRLLVDDEDVRLEHLGGVLDDRAAQLQRLLDVQVQVERGVFAAAQLDHAGHAHEIDARAEIEGADDRRAGQDQHRDVLEFLHQRMRDGAAAAQMAEAHRIVAVDQDAAVQTPLRHVRPLPSRPSISRARSRRKAGILYEAMLLPSDA